MTKYRLAWATDIHLEFCDDAVIDGFLQSVVAAAPNGLLLTGDIGQAPSVGRFLARIEKAIGCPIYFVLGNHDFYKGSIAEVRSALLEQLGADTRLRWLRSAGVVTVAPRVALIGTDGWADGRFGDYRRSPVMLNDYILIRELSGIHPDERLRRMQQLADQDAAILERNLDAALADHAVIVVGTHVPPFAAAAWHEGKQSDDNWLPHFSSKACGDVLLRAAESHPGHQIVVFCGHTHGGGVLEVRPNLRVTTGAAEYGSPKLQQVIDLDSAS